MKAIVIIFLLVAFTYTVTATQDCAFYFPQKEGVNLTYQHYDKKGKPSGKTSQEVVSFKSEASNSTATIKANTYDDKDNIISEIELELRCEAGIFYVDMESYLNQQTMSAYEDLDVEVDMTELEIPSELNVGDKLNDGSITATISTNGIRILSVTVQITDRIVELEEDVTTSAGTFSCYKINQTISTSMGRIFTSKSSEWIAENTGMVQNKTFNKKGELTARSELVKIE